MSFSKQNQHYIEEIVSYKRRYQGADQREPRTLSYYSGYAKESSQDGNVKYYTILSDGSREPISDVEYRTLKQQQDRMTESLYNHSTILQVPSQSPRLPTRSQN